MAVLEKPNLQDQIQKIIQHIIRTMLLGIYPRHCPFCSKLLPSSLYVCKKCREEIPYVKPPVCYRCGKTVSTEEQEFCYDCRVFKKSFQKGLALFYYKQNTRILMSDLKYHNKKYFSEFIIQEVMAVHAPDLISWGIQYIVPIPIHENKKKRRGYNQAALLAKELSRQSNIPCIPDLLLRIKDTPPQKKFSARSRYQNLSTAFQFNQKYAQLPLDKILLIDDIYTTGATMEACTKVLLSAGISDVFIYSICIGASRD